MFHPNALTFARRSALSLALLCALGSPAATADTAGLCKLMANTTIQNVSGQPLTFSSSDYSPNDAVITNNELLQAGIPNGRATGFAVNYQGLPKTLSLSFHFQDPIYGYQEIQGFTLYYWAGSEGGSQAAAEIVGTTVKESFYDTQTSNAAEMLGVGLPPPVGEILAARDLLKWVITVAKDLKSSLSDVGYLNVYQNTSRTKFADVTGISQDTNLTQTVVIPSGGDRNIQLLGATVVNTLAFTPQCANSWNVSVLPYCAQVCSQYKNAGTPTSLIGDTNGEMCILSGYCAADFPHNKAFGKTATASSTKTAGSGITYDAANVTDGNPGWDHGWSTSALGTEQWVSVDLGASTTITRVMVMLPRLGFMQGIGYGPVKLQVSSDNKTWTDYYSQSLPSYTG